MTGERLVPLLLVACSVFVLGTMAASLDATVTSSPRDGIDVDTDSLPFVGDGVSDVAASYDQGGDTERTGADQSGDGVGGSSGDERDQAEPVTGSDATQQPPDSSAGDQSTASGGGGEGDQQRGGDGAKGGDASGPGNEGGAADSPPSLLEQLLLAALILLAVLAVAAGTAYAIRRRERIVALLWSLALRYGLVSTADAVPAGVPEDEDEASTVVERAWAEMLRRSGADCAASDTPRECAAAAIATGVDREPVEELTSLYERTRYGEHTVTPDHASRALGLLRDVQHRHWRQRA